MKRIEICYLLVLLPAFLYHSANSQTKDLPEETKELIESLENWESIQLEKYQDLVEAKRKEVVALMKAHLEKTTKTGDLEGALAIKEKIEFFESEAGTPVPVGKGYSDFNFKGEWVLTIPETKYSERRQISEDHVSTANGDLLPYKIQGSYVRIHNIKQDHWGTF